MKKKKFFQILFCAIVSIALIAWAFEILLADFFSFDPETKGIVQVIAEGCGGYCSEEGTFYYTVANRNRIQTAEPFEPDEMRVYYVSESDLLRSPFRKEENIPFAPHIEAEDENGQKVEITQELKDIVCILSQIDHNIMDLKVMKNDSLTFVYFELNVNWHHPCRLYYYNPENRSLCELYRQNGKKIIDIKVLNPELLKDLEPTYHLNPDFFHKFCLYSLLDDISCLLICAGDS